MSESKKKNVTLLCRPPVLLCACENRTLNKPLLLSFTLKESSLYLPHPGKRVKFADNQQNN